MDRKLTDRLDFTKRDQPEPTTDMRELLIGWLDYQRHEFKRKAS